ncbi:hypothetical protein ZWY2020_028775 [Hordeum vulgare]|nr:hypothetical protein ZWY2020_028775 [Hordeum vulgare]
MLRRSMRRRGLRRPRSGCFPSCCQGEIAQDFVFFRGTQPRLGKKRPRPVQRQLDSLCPGLCLVDVTPDSYKIEER